MIRDYKAIEQAQSEISRLRRGAEIVGMWFFVTTMMLLSLVGFVNW